MAGSSSGVEWNHSQRGRSKLHDLVLETHELENGVVVDLPAHRYDEVVDLVNGVEQESQDIGSGLTFTLGRKENVILLTATSNDPEGQSLIRSIMGLAS